MSVSFLKKLSALTGVLLAVWIFYLYRLVPHRQEPFAGNVDLARQVLIEDGVQKTRLSKQQAVGWMVLLPSGASLPTDEGTIKGLFSNLKQVQLEDEISERADRASEYEVDASSGLHVTLQDAKGTMLASGIFGKQAPDASHVYFRYPDKPMVYLARGLMRGELGRADPNSWRSHELVSIAETKIQKILLSSGGLKMNLIRVSSETWTLNGKPANMDVVNSLVGTLAHLRGEAFIDPASSPGLSYEKLTYAHVLINGTDAAVDLRIGHLDATQKRYPASVGKAAGLMWLARAPVETILQIKQQ